MPDPQRPLRGLPGFVWDERLARYRVISGGYGQRAGTLVGRDRVMGLVADKIEESQNRLAALTTQFRNGNLSVHQWQVAFSEQLKTLYIQQAALGAGGYDKLTFRDYGRIGGYLRAEYARLEGFARDILSEKTTALADASRSRMYGGKARAMYFATHTEVEREAGMAEERRILGSAEHCKVCPDLAAQGWVPIGTQPYPGSHPECFGACHCTMEYRQAPEK